MQQAREAALEHFEKGRTLFEKGDCLAALAQFEKSLSLDSSNLLCQSYIALLMATERGQVQKAVSVMREIMEKNPPDDPEIYLNTGKICFRAGLKAEAIEAVRKGMAFKVTPEAVDFLDRMGVRKRPVLPFLSRNNFLNKYLGILFRKLGLR